MSSGRTTASPRQSCSSCGQWQNVVTCRSCSKPCFFARWCNRDATLNALSPELLADPSALRRALEALPTPPWCNETAYPVGPVQWEGATYNRFECATELFGRIAPFLVRAVQGAGGDVQRATQLVNS